MPEQPQDPRAPEPPHNPYAHPPGPPPSQPLWQGHQAPEQQTGGAGASPEPTGRGGRRWLVVTVITLLLLALVGLGAAAAIILIDDDADTVEVADMEPGDCLSSPDFRDPADEIGGIEVVDCAGEHDAEVFATLEFELDEDLDAVGSRCVDALDETGRTFQQLSDKGLEIRPLADGDEPGDTVVCFIRSRDGAPLTGSEFE